MASSNGVYRVAFASRSNGGYVSDKQSPPHDVTRAAPAASALRHTFRRHPHATAESLRGDDGGVCWARPTPSRPASNRRVGLPILPFVYQEVRRLTLAARVALGCR